MSFLFFGLISHSSHSLSSSVRFLKVSDIFMALSWTHSTLSISVVPGSPEMNTELQICLTSVQQREGITSLNLLATLCAIQPRRLLTFFVVRVGYQLIFSLVFMRTPWSFSAQLPVQLSGTPCRGSWDYFSPGAGVDIFLPWTSWGSSSPNPPACKVPSNVSRILLYIKPYSHIIFPADLLRVHPVPSLNP